MCIPLVVLCGQFMMHGQRNIKYLNLTTDASFHILFNSLFNSRHIIGSDTDKIVKKAINRNTDNVRITLKCSPFM